MTIETRMRSPLCGCISCVVNGLVGRGRQHKDPLQRQLLGVAHAKSVDGVTGAEPGLLCPGYAN